MNFSKQTKFILAIILQLFIIGTIIIFKASVIVGGTEIVFKVVPVDPRDIFRGDYMVLSYQDVSRINKDLFEYDQIKRGQDVYVEINKSGDYWKAVRATDKKPKGKEIYIKGVVSSSNTGDFISVNYGIENYFIPEKTGQNIDLRNSNPYIKAAVDRNGNAVLKQLYIYDKPFENISREEIKILQADLKNDARIITDLRKIQLGLELYYDANRTYASKIEDLSPVFLANVPKNPLTGRGYDYCKSESGEEYVVGARLANINNEAMTNSANESVELKYCDPNPSTICAEAGYFCAAN